MLPTFKKPRMPRTVTDAGTAVHTYRFTRLCTVRRVQKKRVIHMTSHTATCVSPYRFELGRGEAYALPRHGGAQLALRRRTLPAPHMTARSAAVVRLFWHTLVLAIVRPLANKEDARDELMQQRPRCDSQRR